MQQMAGHMNLLNPFVFNQFGAYGAYAQVRINLALAQSIYTSYLMALQIKSAATTGRPNGRRHSPRIVHQSNGRSSHTNTSLDQRKTVSANGRIQRERIELYVQCGQRWFRPARCQRLDSVAPVSHNAHIQYGRANAQRSAQRQRRRLLERRTTTVPRP